MKNLVIDDHHTYNNISVTKTSHHQARFYDVVVAVLHHSVGKKEQVTYDIRVKEAVSTAIIVWNDA